LYDKGDTEVGAGNEAGGVVVRNEVVVMLGDVSVGVTTRAVRGTEILPIINPPL